MKLFATLILFVMIFQGCGEKNAFSRFEISQKQELGLNSLKSSKLKEDLKVNGEVSVVYLNQINPKRFKGSEVFYIYMYLKDTSLPLTFTLNGEAPSLSVKQLTNTNEFTYLTSAKAKWNQYYIVTFAKQGDSLNLKVFDGNFSSNELKFEKDQ